MKCLQEGPDAISVDGLEFRTSNFAESQNTVFSKMITNSTFFKVVDKLLVDETRKVQDLNSVLDGETGIYREPDAVYKSRSAFIQQAQQDLLYGLSVDDFLQRLTCRYNPVNYNLAHFDGMLSDDDDEDDFM